MRCDGDMYGVNRSQKEGATKCFYEKVNYTESDTRVGVKWATTPNVLFCENMREDSIF